MKKLIFAVLYIFTLVSLNAQSVSEWLRSINMAKRVVEEFKTNGRTTYQINSYTDGSFIVYDVYGVDVRVYQNGDAIIFGRADLRVLNSVYNRMFNEIIVNYGRPLAGGSSTQSTFSFAQIPTSNGVIDQYLELKLDPFASEISLKLYSKQTRWNGASLFSIEWKNDGRLNMDMISKNINWFNIRIDDSFEQFYSGTIASTKQYRYGEKNVEVILDVYRDFVTAISISNWYNDESEVGLAINEFYKAIGGNSSNIKYNKDYKDSGNPVYTGFFVNKDLKILYESRVWFDEDGIPIPEKNRYKYIFTVSIQKLEE